MSGGTLAGVPYDTRVDLAARTRTWSLFASDTVAMAGDPPLKQGVARTLEAGLRGAAGASPAGAARWNIGLFRADNHDDILFAAENAGGYGYFKNFGQTRPQGLEAGFSLPLPLPGAGEGLAAATVGANYTWLDASYRSQGRLGGAANSSNDQASAGLPGLDGQIEVRAGDRLPLIPRHLLKLFADLPLGPAWSVGADITALAGALARGNESNAHQLGLRYRL